MSTVPRRTTPPNTISTASDATAAESKIEGLPKTSTATPTAASTGWAEMFRKKLDTTAFSGIIDMMSNKEALDDRKMLMEHLLMFMAQLPEGDLSKKLNEEFIKLLYNDLEHPAPTLLGQQYAFRTADGSYNNIDVPNLGKAGLPYARSVQPVRPLPAADMPDAGLIFDSLLKRDGFIDHPAGCSSLMFAFAALVIHSVFRTKHGDPTVNETSSYVDLSPLYGHNQELQDKLRVKDGRGKLLPDVFAEDRLLLLPPAVCVLLVLFSRNHNFIASKLLEINERGHLVNPETIKDDEKKLKDQDEWIFQTARLINAQWFATVVFSDYISAILGLVREGNSWILNPFGAMRNADHSVFERGRGNVCSIEFNSLYRWHATASRNDTKWNDDLFQRVFPGKTFDNVTPMDMRQAMAQIQTTKPDVTAWTFGGIKRQPDGTFKDDDLAKILHDATADPAGAFRARGIPASMRLHEIMGIEGNRRLGVCSMNEFRKYLGLKPFETFREWNSDPSVADVAEKLYGDIENLELYVGLQAEEAKPVVDGAGLCPGYTISRCILSDAIALTRGDRFFTTDYTPNNLTAWGFDDSARQPNGAGFGGTLGRLFLRTLPNHYNANSIYTWFPMITPVSMKKFLNDLGKASDYDMNRPGLNHGPIRTLTDHETVSTVIKKNDVFVTPYSVRASKVVKGKGFFTAEPDAALATKQRDQIMNTIIGSYDSKEDIPKFFYDMTRKLIELHCYPMINSKTRAVDVIRDVLKALPLHWIAEELVGIDIVGPGEKIADYKPLELFDKLCDIYTYIFLDFDTYQEIELQTKVKADVEELLGRIRSGTGVGAKRMSFIGKASRLFKKSVAKKETATRLRSLSDSSEFLEASLLAVLVSSVELSLALINMLDEYLPPQGGAPAAAAATDKDHHVGVAQKALATNPPFRGVYRVAKTKHDDFNENDKVFLDIALANTRANLSPDHALSGDVLNKCLGDELTHKIMAEVLRAITSFEGVRRAPGRSGTLVPCEDSSKPTIRKAYLKDGKVLSPWPNHLVLQFEQKA